MRKRDEEEEEEEELFKCRLDTTHGRWSMCIRVVIRAGMFFHVYIRSL